MHIPLKTRASHIVVACLLLSVVLFAGCAERQLDVTPIPDDEKTTLQYVADFEFAPYRVATDEGYFGYEIDVNNAIFSGTSYKLNYRFEDLGIDQLEELAKRDDIDILGWRVITPVTQQYMLVSDPVYEFNWGAVTLPHIGELKEEDYFNYRIGMTYRKYPYNYLVTQLGITDYVVYDNYGDAAEALVNGDIDIWFEEKEITNYYLIRTSHYATTIFHEETNIPMDVGLLIRPDLVDLHREVNERIAAIKKDNQLESFYMRYFQKHSSDYLKQQEIRTRNIILLSTAVVAVFAFATFMIFRFNRKYRRTSQELAAANFSLAETKEQYTTAVSGSNDGILYYSDRSGALVLSDRFCEILGIDSRHEYTLEQLGAVLYQRVRDEYHHKISEFCSFIREKLTGFFESEFHLKEGPGAQWVSIRVKFKSTDANWTAGGVLSDISARKEAEDRTLFFARHDYLTGIYNRMYLMELATEYLTSAQTQHKTFCVLYIDLDNFKKINDTYGHDHGDEALRRTVDAIGKVLPTDAIFARVGGDEFVIVLPPQYDMEAICTELIEKISDIHIHDFQIGASIGIACYPEHGSTIDALITIADLASRRAKQLGKNRWAYSGHRDGC